MADPSSLTRVQDAVAERVSSNNPDPESNDDSWRPIAGETVTLADLTGPGVVTHLWITVAANEYGWPRLLRLRAYYDGSAIPSVDCPLGDFFGVGHGFERPVNSLMVRDSSSGRSRNSYWQMPFTRQLAAHHHERGPPARLEPLLPRGLEEGAVAAARDRVLPRAYRQALPTASGPAVRNCIDARVAATTSAPSSASSRTSRAGSAKATNGFFVDGVTEAVDRRHGHRGLLQRRLELPRLRRSLHGRDGRRWHRRRRPDVGYRWHVVDPVPFQRSLRLDIEHRGWTYKRTARCDPRSKSGPICSAASRSGTRTALRAISRRSRMAPPRLPIGNARQIEAEDTLPGVTVEQGKASVQKDVFWSRTCCSSMPRRGLEDNCAL